MKQTGVYIDKVVNAIMKNWGRVFLVVIAFLKDQQ